ncbi:A-kinase anchor protein 9 isoform X4 [Dunckerocampus dactyliophorus]|uniref:A-kinase anchor protein 9 isoform X4 n=1 Tax=Dunckerocampus dactyliophorus TaxID=161453 RepID=UPI002405E595|nr:A-kinase anchor protein 9 isoform X4 [Dunckerocampus dactyliophorus]
MEDEERQKKLEAGKAKLAEYRQRKAHADSQKKQKKKKKKRSEEDSQGSVEVEQDCSVGCEDDSVGGRDGAEEGNKEQPPTTELSLSRTLRSRETVKHDQTYTIEPESEVSTTAEDYSSEQVNGCREMTDNLMTSSKDFIWEEAEPLREVMKGGRMQDIENALAAKTQAVEELSQELEEIRAAFGTEGVQKLQDFEAALKQRDGIITQLTANLQQAREEKDEIMKEFLELTEQSQKLQIQFQQLQAGETMRNTSHSSTAADLLQARQQLVQYQLQLDEANAEARKNQERSCEQQQLISQLQHKLSDVEMSGRRSEETLTQRINEKNVLIAEKEKVIMIQERSLAQLRTAEEALAKTLKEKNQLISEQMTMITEHEQSLTVFREEVAVLGSSTNDSIIPPADEKDLVIAEQERIISDRDCSLSQLEEEMETSQQCLRGLQQRVAAKELELKRCLGDLEGTKRDLESCKGEMESYKLQLEKAQGELQSCKSELVCSRQRERMSSDEIKQLMGTVEDLQKRCHQGSLSEGDAMQRMQEDTTRKLDVLRAELDEMYGQQIVQMKQEINLQHVARLEQMAAQHHTEMELLKEQNSTEEETLTVKIRALQETLEQSQVSHNKAMHELTQEKLNLKAKAENLHRGLRSAKEKVELVSSSFVSQESHQAELRRLQETISDLQHQLAAAQEAALETETKHESETTNYKIKLEMMEREKDAVLDRMAESQEAELERLRTQLLFSHEEELTHLREELQRGSFLNTENLLNEAAVKHQKTLDDLRLAYEDELHLLQREKSAFSTEREELLHQILGLKEDLKLALHSSKADELVQQLEELQVELKDLRKGGDQCARLENEIQMLLKKTEALEDQTREKEQCWKSKWKEQQVENDTLKENVDLKTVEIETLKAETSQMQCQVVELREEIEKQRTTFSFAEKNFEVNYQELKEEYRSLVETKTQPEERTLKESLDFEAKVAGLQSQIQELDNGKVKTQEMCREAERVVEKDTTELTQKLQVTLSEKESLTVMLSEVTEQLVLSEEKVGQLEEELKDVRRENAKFITQNESLLQEVKRMRSQDGEKRVKPQQEELKCEGSFEDHHAHIQSLRRESDAPQWLLVERDCNQQTLELQRLSPSPAVVQSSAKGPVEGRFLQKASASGSNRRKRRQRLKQERKVSGTQAGRQKEEEEEEEGRATSAAEPEMQTESQVFDDGDSADGCQGDDTIKQVSSREGDYHSESVACQEAAEHTPEHGECRLQMEAQRISLTQIHAAQLELLQEEADNIQNQRDAREQDAEEQGTKVSHSEELERLKLEAQEKQHRLEENHRQEMERVQAHYQQRATEMEERYTTEILVLQQRLQEVMGAQLHYSVPECREEYKEELKDLTNEQLLEWVSGARWPARSTGLSAQLQTLRRALYNKYVQEVAALKVQHSSELRRLREEREQERTREQSQEGRREHDRDLCSVEVSSITRQRVEEEVAKAIVQMSVEFAQQTEQARINKRACQTSASMQTQSDEEDVEERDKEASTLGASASMSAWLKEERERLESELEERNTEIQKLQEKLQKAELEALRKKKEDDEAEVVQGEHGTSQGGAESVDKDNERILLRSANQRLSRVLADVLKTTAAAEETMGLHMQSLQDASSSEGLQGSHTPSRHGGAGFSGEICLGGETDAGLEVSKQMIDSLLLGESGSQLENEEHLMSISSRLQTALEKMLMVITDTTNQVEHARITQTELMRESFRHNQEISELLQKQEELQDRLSEEARAREQLALELHRAEDVIDGYTGERAALEEQLRQKEELQLSLEQELQVTSSRLQELEQERLQMQEEREMMSRQHDAMREDAGPRELRLVDAAMVAAPEADLLEEAEKLMKEKVEVQRQAEKESSDLLKQMKLLEAELEEQVNRVIELEHARKAETRDLQQQIQALEKQMDKNRRFLDEQAVDREHERDVFQNEIHKLEQQLKNPQKLQSGSEQRSQEVEHLTSQLKEKADWCSELLLSSEQLRRELGERDQEIDKLESRIRELEQALLASTESLEKDEQKRCHTSITEAAHSTLEAQLQTEREALERKEKEICNLEEQLEQFREELENKSEEVQQLHMQLEIQRKEISSQQQYLETRESMLQVMEQKDREIVHLNEQITKLKHMEKTSGNKGIDERDELIKDLESQVECLRSEQERLKSNSEEEVDQLNAVIDKLQQELVHIEPKRAAGDEFDACVEPHADACGPSRAEYDEMKQKMDLASKEFDTLKMEHDKLLETHQLLQESVVAQKEKCKDAEAELEEKTAAFVVVQAQVQALEQSAASSMTELRLRIHELEDSVGEKDSELSRCRLLVEQTQNHADDLQLKVTTLEEDLREKVAAVLVSNATLEAFQQQQQQQSHTCKEDHHPQSFGDFGLSQMDFSLPVHARQAPRGKVVHLTQKLCELEASLSGIQKDQELQKQLLSSSEEDVLEYEKRLAVLMDLLSQMTVKTRPRTSPAAEVSSGGILQELEKVREEALYTKEQLHNYREQCSNLQEELKEKTEAVDKLKGQLQKASSQGDEETQVLQGELMKSQNEAAGAKEELNSCKESLEKLQELLQERELTIAQLKGEVFQVKAEEDKADRTELLKELHKVRSNADSTKEELSSYKSHNEKLQEDILVRELSICKLNEELQQFKNCVDTTKEELNSYKLHNEKLHKDIQVRETSVCQLKEELQEVKNNVDAAKEELNTYKSQNEKLQEEIQVRETSVCKLKEELQEVRNNVDATKEELNGYRRHNEKLKEDIQVRELSICKLKEELQEMQAALLKPADSAPPSPAQSPHLFSSASSSSTPSQPSQPKRKASKQQTAKGSSTKEKTSLSRKSSVPPSQSSTKNPRRQLNSSSDSEQQGRPMSDAFTQTEVPAVTDCGEEPPAAATKEELEEVIGEFQDKIVQMQELHAAEILDMEARHISESDSLRRDMQNLEDECKALKAVIDKLRSTEASLARQDRPLSQFKDGYTSDSSSDYSQRTGYDLPGHQQEFRVTPEGSRRETDDQLPDRIKTLLREVHQEGMQVLSLSELPLSEGEPACHFNLQAWVKEKDALLATVESLKGIIAQMQTTQVSGAEDWRAELLDAVRQVFVRERSVLKSALYSQLDLLDTSDAIIHLNQLERRLAEQDAQHKEAMGSLLAADRSSLRSEIYRLRGQLEHLHQDARPAMFLAGEHSMTDRRGGRGDGPMETDRLLLEELKNELSQTKLELETTLKAQHKHLKELDTLRAEVSQKAAEVDTLNDQLLEESKRGRELQWAMEKERCRIGRSEESTREELEDLNLALEEQKSHVTQLSSTLEQERLASSQLCQQAEREKLSLHRHLQELQVQLETERAKAQEMSAALGRERELRVGGVSSGDGQTNERENLLEGLQKDLDDKHAQVVHLLSQVEAHKLESVRKEEELVLVGHKSRKNHEALLEAQIRVENLKAELLETREQLETEVERRRSLEKERERLEGRLAQTSGTPQPPLWEITSGGHHHGPWRTVDTILGKLQLVSSKLRSMATKTVGRSSTEVSGDELSLLQSTVGDVITMLQQSPGLPSMPESAALLAGGSGSTSLTERLLRQNAELTGFVSRLTEEKNDLRNHSLRLEEELRCYRHAGLGSGDSSSGRRGVSKLDSADMLLLCQEREVWTREKVLLEKALHQANAQVARLRGEIRTDTLREITGPEADNAALKRMYGKYLRSESFRKALIYQKKYLLLLLGGFQECEEATLALLARMGGRPSLSSMESFSQRRRGLMRFRSVVRVSIALSRMRFLVKRWHKTTGMSNVTSKTERGQMMGTEARDSHYLHPGVDMYRDRGGVSNRGRSGRESPRSPTSSTQHRFHTAGDPGGLTCSHLQNYDPDRALTDYISRLEALQRRLGSVTSVVETGFHRIGTGQWKNEHMPATPTKLLE